MRANGSCISVLVVDDDTLAAEALARALESEHDLSVSGVATSSEEAVDHVRAKRPDVVLLEGRLPGGAGTRAAAEMRSAAPDTKVLLLTGRRDDAALSAAVDAGCSGVVQRSDGLAPLVDAVRRVHAGEPVFSTDDLSVLMRQLRGESPLGADLTAREREVLQLLADGVGTDSLAERLYISKHTARSHVRNILAKLGAHSKLEAVAIALRSGLVSVG